MSWSERFFHALLFEGFLVVLSVLGMRLFTDYAWGDLGALFVLISLVAMCWNMLFNRLWDQFFRGKREDRGLGLRIAHACCFEGGLLLATVPLIMVFLALDFWSALWADIGMTLFVLVYTVVFNWLYDRIRAKVRNTV